jgi:Methyltransferase domain
MMTRLSVINAFVFVRDNHILYPAWISLQRQPKRLITTTSHRSDWPYSPDPFNYRRRTGRLRSSNTCNNNYSTTYIAAVCDHRKDYYHQTLFARRNSKSRCQLFSKTILKRTKNADWSSSSFRSLRSRSEINCSKSDEKSIPLQQPTPCHLLGNNTSNVVDDKTKSPIILCATENPAVVRSSLWLKERMSKAENVVCRLAKQNRAWKRLRPIIDLAIVSTTIENKGTTCLYGNNGLVKRCSIADIGTDHGLLALGLASTELFDTVVGIDVSLDALNDGAYKLWKNIQERRRQQQQQSALSVFLNTTRIDFRHGDGVKGLNNGEGNIICVAGMGSNTMIDILMAKQQHRHADKRSTIHFDDEDLLVHGIGCHSIILQPTNAKPKQLMKLYQTMHRIGYTVNDERLEFVSERWYLSTLFHRRHNTITTTSSLLDEVLDDEKHLIPVPGRILASYPHANDQVHNTETKTFLEWIRHHENWIRSDQAMTGFIDDDEQRWLGDINKAMSRKD